MEEHKNYDILKCGNREIVGFIDLYNKYCKWKETISMEKFIFLKNLISLINYNNKNVIPEKDAE